MSSFYVLAGVAIALAALCLILRYLIKSGERMIADEKRRIENASRGRARIVAIGKSRTQRPQGTILIRLRLEITPENRQSKFETTTVWEIEPVALAQIQEDSEFKIKYDEQNRQRIYPLAPWANFSELMNKNWNADVA